MNEMFGQVKVECWVERRGGGGYEWQGMNERLQPEEEWRDEWQVSLLYSNLNYIPEDKTKITRYLNNINQRTTQPCQGRSGDQEIKIKKIKKQ